MMDNVTDDGRLPGTTCAELATATVDLIETLNALPGGAGNGRVSVFSPLEPLYNFVTAVEVGDVVKEGQTVMIIEAMKHLNHIPAPRAGRVTAVFVENGQPVEFGEPLLIIE